MLKKPLLIVVLSLIMIFNFSNYCASIGASEEQYKNEKIALMTKQRIEEATLQAAHKKQTAQLKALHAHQNAQFKARWDQLGVSGDYDFDDFKSDLEKKIKEVQEGQGIDAADEGEIKKRIEQWKKEYDKKEVKKNLEETKAKIKEKLEEIKKKRQEK